jgi:outer membrane protein TolC
MNIKFTLASFFLLCIATVAYAQGPVLEGYVQEGLKSNLQLRQEQMSYERSVENLNQARALFFPLVQANASYSLADGGRKIEFPVGDLLNPVYSTLNQLTGTGAFPQVQNVSIQFLPNNFHDTKLRVIQPLFNPDIYFNYKAQKELITVQAAQKNTYENELKYNITSAYYQYVQAHEAVGVLSKTRLLTQELVKLNSSLVQNEKATRDVQLNAEYELAKIDYQISDAAKNEDVARAYFNFLLNKDLSAPIVIDTTMAAAHSTQYTLDSLKQTALMNRSEIKQVEGGLHAGEQSIGLAKGNALLPKLNVVGDVGYQGYQYKFDSDQRYWLVQFNLTWDLFRGGERRSKTQQAKIDYQITENKMEQLKKQIELQVIQAYRTREAAQHSYIAAQSGVRNATRSFQIINTKYKAGQVILLEYLDAQNKMTTARLTETLSTYELLRAEAMLRKTIANL